MITALLWTCAVGQGRTELIRLGAMHWSSENISKGGCCEPLTVLPFIIPGNSIHTTSYTNNLGMTHRKVRTIQEDSTNRIVYVYTRSSCTPRGIRQILCACIDYLHVIHRAHIRPIEFESLPGPSLVPFKYNLVLGAATVRNE